MKLHFTNILCMLHLNETSRSSLNFFKYNTKHMIPAFERVMSHSTNSTSIRLLQVDGYDGRKNDVIYCKPSIPLPSNSVVYFGGDVQDFKEKMEMSHKKRPFLKWNLDNMTEILSSKFPESHVVVIKPSRMDFDSYSCFVNFVPSKKYGVPEHVPMNYAFEHLLKLLSGVSLSLNSTTSKQNIPIQDLSATKLILIGFSKGCVVLNQLIYEFHHINTSTPNDIELHNRISQIQDVFWLDSGHGGRNVFLTSRKLLQTLAESGIRIHIHVTPYQVRDELRPWIGQEESQFTMLLDEFNASFERTLHFANEEGSLNLHYEILSAFKTSIGGQSPPD